MTETRSKTSTPTKPTIPEKENESTSSSKKQVSESPMGNAAKNSNEPRSAMTVKAVSNDEKKKGKIVTRVGYGALMVFGLLFILYSGHVYVCFLISFLEVLLFSELVTVRYNNHLEKIEKIIPLFRTTQWMWFFVAINYVYGEFAADVIKSNAGLHYLGVTYHFKQFQSTVAFVMYATAFVTTVVTLQKDQIRFQLNQLCWTICVLFLTVGQLKYVMHNVFNGLFWFTFPVSLVIFNDIMAYACGMLFGKKYIQKTFLALSPNKTWEGFIGGGICTIIFGWFLCSLMAKFTWMTCPISYPEFLPDVLECKVNDIFIYNVRHVPEFMLEVLPYQLSRQIPGIVEYCKTGAVVSECLLPTNVNLSPRHHAPHHHFELYVNILPIQFHSIPLSIFASIVAPFGGFLASGIKRAYGIKDFGSLVPGHGGIMDRMDCQFLMALCSWVYYNAFVKMATVSVAKVLYMYKMLDEGERKEFVDRIGEMSLS